MNYYSKAFALKYKTANEAGAENIRVHYKRKKRRKAVGLCATIFVTLAKPTKPMIADAVSAGFFECDFGKYPRVQILTVDVLLQGAKPKLPLVDQSVAFRKAQKESAEEKLQGKIALDIRTLNEQYIAYVLQGIHRSNW